MVNRLQSLESAVGTYSATDPVLLSSSISTVKEVLGLVSLVTVAPYQVGLTPTFNCCDIGVGEGNKPG